MDLKKIKQWVWPTVIGLVVGMILMPAAFGFVTSGTAADMATEHARVEVVKALVPICMVRAQADPQYSVRLAALNKVSSWSQKDKLDSFGWAVMQGSEQPADAVSKECARQLLETIKKE